MTPTVSHECKYAKEIGELTASAEFIKEKACDVGRNLSNAITSFSAREQEHLKIIEAMKKEATAREARIMILEDNAASAGEVSVLNNEVVALKNEIKAHKDAHDKVKTFWERIGQSLLEKLILGLVSGAVGGGVGYSIGHGIVSKLTQGG